MKSTTAQPRGSDSSALFAQLAPDPVGEILGTGYQRFMAHQPGIGGLCKISGDKLSILAITSRHEGRGHVRDFFSEAKSHFRYISVESIWSPKLLSALRRWGFRVNGDSAEWANDEMRDRSGSGTLQEQQISKPQ